MNTMYQRYCAFFWGTIISTFAIAVSASLPHVIDDDVFELKVSSDRNDGLTHIELQVVPRGNVHCNLEFPWKVKVLDTKNIEFVRSLFSRSEAKEFTAQKVVFRLPVKLLKPGASVNLEMKLSMCDDKQCFMKTVPIKYTVK